MATTLFLEPGMDATQDGSFFVGLNVSAGSTAAYDSSQSHDGPGSMKCVVTVSGQTASPFTKDVVSDAGACISAWFRFSTVTPATLTNFLMVLTSGNGSGRMGLGINTNGTINFANKGSASQANGSTTLSANTWYRISLSYTDVSTSTWAAKVYLNGTLEINASAGVQGNGTANSTACVSFGQNASSLGSFSTPGVSTIWIDSMYIDNRSDLTDCGDISVTAKRPNANGTTNGFTTQIGSGGSGYGTGHSPQVNERPLSTTNGWSMVGAGSAVTEEYSIESSSTGDVDISAATIKDFMGWVYAKSALSETGSIIVAGSSSNISLTSTNTMFTKAAGSTTYPAGNTDIGIVTSTTVTTVSLYECGILVAYIPSSAVNATVTQVAANVTAAGGTQTVATVNIVAVSQVAASVTATGGTQSTQIVTTQSAASVTATGGTQSVATVNIVSVTQVAGSVTASGGTQVVDTVNIVSLSQTAATLTASGGTQVVATIQDVQVTQVAANVTATGGTQSVDTINIVSLDQVVASISATGGTQVVDTVNIVSLDQVAAIVTAAGGTQVVEAHVAAAVDQLAAVVTATGGIQDVSASSGTLSASIDQLAASVTATGGLQIVTISTSPLPPSKSPNVILLLDGRVAMRTSNNIYLPL